MRRLPAFLLVLLVCCTTLGPSDRGLHEAESQASKTVMVAQKDEAEGDGHYFGSAFLIYATKNDRGTYTGWFLTAGHVVNLKTETTALFRRRGDSKKYYARITLDTIKTHPKWDAAVFQVTGLPSFFAQPLPIAKNVPMPNQWVLSAGYGGPDLAMYLGQVRSMHTLPLFGPCFMSDARVLAGMSGGPVLNIDGEVLGHTVAKGSDNEHFFIPVQLLRVWLATIR